VTSRGKPDVSAICSDKAGLAENKGGHSGSCAGPTRADLQRIIRGIDDITRGCAVAAATRRRETSGAVVLKVAVFAQSSRVCAALRCGDLPTPTEFGVGYYAHTLILN